MGSKTVNVALKEDLLRDIDRTARAESRSRSDLLRGAARSYIQRRDRWNSIFEMGDKLVESEGLKPDDVSRQISEHRSTKGPRR